MEAHCVNTQNSQKHSYSVPLKPSPEKHFDIAHLLDSHFNIGPRGTGLEHTYILRSLARGKKAGKAKRIPLRFATGVGLIDDNMPGCTLSVEQN